MFALSRSCLVVCFMFAACVPLIAGDTSKSEPQITCPKTVESVRVPVQVTVPQNLLAEKRDFRLVVIPVLQDDTAYIQFGKVILPSSKKVVYVGVETKQVDEEFQILLISAPAGAISKDGPIKLSALEMLEYKIHATAEVHRLK